MTGMGNRRVSLLVRSSSLPCRAHDVTSIRSREEDYNCRSNRKICCLSDGRSELSEELASLTGAKRRGIGGCMEAPTARVPAVGRLQGCNRISTSPVGSLWQFVRELSPTTVPTAAAPCSSSCHTYLSIAFRCGWSVAAVVQILHTKQQQTGPGRVQSSCDATCNGQLSRM